MKTWASNNLNAGSTTIAAIATAIVPEQGSIGIVRVSGPEAIAIARAIFHSPGHQPWESHRILYGYIRQPQSQVTVDEALLLLMLAPRSFTREDVVEFHCHGGMIAVQQVLQLCIEQGARLAQPGEFTLRAFLNGRLDLTQAESVADLVGAKSPQAAQTAIAGLQGKLATPIQTLHQQCLELLADIEARIDFADDLPPLNVPDLIHDLQQMRQTMVDILATADQGELLRSGLNVAIVGRPNVGKSSLLNAWSQSDRAIVTDLPGTTRDVVESHLVVKGIPIKVLDTAGIRAASDQVEKIGVARSLHAAERADLVLFTIDGQVGWQAEDQILLDRLSHPAPILIINKMDLVDQIPTYPLESFINAVYTSALSQKGIESLEAAIIESIHRDKVKAANLDIAINQRQAAALQQALTCLEQVCQSIEDELPLDFWSIDLRSAIQRLGEITGKNMVESVLDRIFSKFCIGK